MKSCALTLFSALCLFWVTSLVIAGEQRVLLSFDNSGHQVRHIVISESSRSFRSSMKDQEHTQKQHLDIELLISRLQPGVAVLVWKNDRGHSNTSTEQPDPRVSHAPAHILGSAMSRLGQTQGAWLLVGPERATSVIILLPADPALGLAFEQWEVSLETR